MTNRIGFFLHTPFPTSELYRILPVRGKLLQGILASGTHHDLPLLRKARHNTDLISVFFTALPDLIGFQTYHDCRHFLSACTRVLALDSQPKVSTLTSLYRRLREIY